METLRIKQLDSEDASLAIAPNIFDAYLHPDILLPLVLGNLLSTRLWNLSARIAQRLKQAQLTELTPPDPMANLRAIQREIDRNFIHLQQNEVTRIYGELNLNDERSRLGQNNIDQAVQELLSFYLNSPLIATWPDEVAQSIVCGLQQEKFPAFYYANFDVIRAHRFLKGSRANAPMGLTSCLDEISIFAALAMTLPPGIVENVIVLSCLTHYTAFGWTQTGESWWLYGKNKFFTRHEWEQFVEQKFNGDAQKAFNQLFQNFDRVTSVAGTFDLQTGAASIIPAHIDEIVEKLDQFFGLRLEQLQTGLARPKSFLPEATLTPILRELLGTRSIEQARARLLGSEEDACKRVLYSYRSLQQRDLLPYLRVARHNPNTKKLGQTLKSLQEAVEIIQSINGQTSIFEDRNRIAMPDETLRLQTGSDIDKALLLHILIEHCQIKMGHNVPTSTLITDSDSFVCSGEFCLSLNTMAQAPRPQAGIIMEFSDLAKA